MLEPIPANTEPKEKIKPKNFANVTQNAVHSLTLIPKDGYHLTQSTLVYSNTIK